LADALKHNSALLALVADRHKKLRRQAAERKPAGGEKKPDPCLTLGASAPDPTYAENYRLNKALIKAMADYCKSRGIRFMLVCIDTGGYVPLVEEAWKKADPTFDVNFFEDDLARYSRSQGIEYLGLQRFFRQRFERTGSTLHWWPPLHWGHWNYGGHQAAADLRPLGGLAEIAASSPVTCQARSPARISADSAAPDKPRPKQ
jgi:hypothetical protein